MHNRIQYVWQFQQINSTPNKSKEVARAGTLAIKVSDERIYLPVKKRVISYSQKSAEETDSMCPKQKRVGCHPLADLCPWTPPLYPFPHQQPRGPWPWPFSTEWSSVSPWLARRWTWTFPFRRPVAQPCLAVRGDTVALFWVMRRSRGWGSPRDLRGRVTHWRGVPCAPDSVCTLPPENTKKRSVSLHCHVDTPAHCSQIYAICTTPAKCLSITGTIPANKHKTPTCRQVSKTDIIYR